ncbi:MAG: hypothetical protein OSJ43_16355 [Oscillospiraceae bacterium]|nr:hypothetical protein [Oscillospiraceae bacterium]
MAEYIEREKIYADISRFLINKDSADLTNSEDGWTSAISEAMDMIKNAPAADIRPERHGYWIDKTQWYGHLGRILTQCSECGFEIEGDPTSRNTGMGGKYCENCGAKMNGKPKRLRDITKKNGNGEE